MENPTSAYKEFTSLFLDALKEPNRAEVYDYILNKSKNFQVLEKLSVEAILSSRRYLRSLADRRGCRNDLDLVLNKVPDKNYCYKKYVITFVDLYKKCCERPSLKYKKCREDTKTVFSSHRSSKSTLKCTNALDKGFLKNRRPTAKLLKTAKEERSSVRKGRKNSKADQQIITKEQKKGIEDHKSAKKEGKTTIVAPEKEGKELRTPEKGSSVPKNEQNTTKSELKSSGRDRKIGEENQKALLKSLDFSKSLPKTAKYSDFGSKTTPKRKKTTKETKTAISQKTESKPPIDNSESRLSLGAGFMTKGFSEEKRISMAEKDFKFSDVGRRSTIDGVLVDDSEESEEKYSPLEDTEEILHQHQRSVGKDIATVKDDKLVIVLSSEESEDYTGSKNLEAKNGDFLVKTEDHESKTMLSPESKLKAEQIEKENSEIEKPRELELSADSSKRQSPEKIPKDPENQRPMVNQRFFINAQGKLGFEPSLLKRNSRDRNSLLEKNLNERDFERSSKIQRKIPMDSRREFQSYRPEAKSTPIQTGAAGKYLLKENRPRSNDTVSFQKCNDTEARDFRNSVRNGQACSSKEVGYFHRGNEISNPLGCSGKVSVGGFNRYSGHTQDSSTGRKLQETGTCRRWFSGGKEIRERPFESKTSESMHPGMIRRGEFGCDFPVAVRLNEDNGIEAKKNVAKRDEGRGFDRKIEANKGAEKIPAEIESIGMEEREKFFENEQFKFLRHNDRVVFGSCEGNYLSVCRIGENEESEVTCLNQCRTELRVRKKEPSSKFRFVYYGEEVFLVMKSGKGFLASNYKRIYMSTLSSEPNCNKDNVLWKLRDPKTKENSIPRKNVKIPVPSKVAIVKIGGSKDFRALKVSRGNIIVVNLALRDAFPSWTIFREESPFNLFGSLKKDDFFRLNCREINRRQRKILNESEVVKSILHILIGINDEPNFSASFKEGDFKIKANLDRTCLSFPKRRLSRGFEDISKSFLFIESFAQERKSLVYGLISNALSISLLNVLENYKTLIAAIESSHKEKPITFQKLNLILFPSAQLLATLSNICRRILQEEKDNKREIFGGKLFNLVYSFYVGLGDKKLSKTLLEEIVKPTFKPYLSMLSGWMTRGSFKDPFGEFLVVERMPEGQVDASDQFWRQAFTVTEDTERIPVFLREYSAEILKSGKFVLVLRRVGRSFEFKKGDGLNGVSCLEDVASKVLPIYKRVSESLLTLLVNDEKLVSCLNSFRKVFLQSRGDFLAAFLEAVEEEIGENSRETSLKAFLCVKLEAAISSSVGFSDAFTKRFRVALWVQSFVTQLELLQGKRLNGKLKASGFKIRKIDEIGFAFDAKWPLSIFFTKQVIFRYNLVFRYLFLFKRTDLRMNECWKIFKGLRSVKEEHEELKSAFLLYRKVEHFLRSFSFYCHWSVIDRFWSAMLRNVAEEKTSFDKVLSAHEKLIQALFKFLFMNDFVVLKIIVELNEVALRFAALLEKILGSWCLENPPRFPKNSKVPGKKSASLLSGNNLREYLGTSEFGSKVKELDVLFGLALKKLVTELRSKALEHFEVFSALLYALDFNLYFSN